MTPNNSLHPSGLSAGSSLWRRLLPVSLAVMALSSEAGAAQKTYQYFRFEPKQMQNSSTQIQLSEFTFSLNGTLLNLNNRNGSGTDIVTVSGASGAQDPNAGEGPNKVFDGQPLVSGGSPSTKWFNGAALTQPLDITFAAPVTVDSYNFATANDSASFARTPTGWFLYGRNSTSDPWVVIDFRSGVAVTTANNTYQAGYTIPESVPPIVNYFRVKNSAPDGTAAIVLDSDAAGVKLEWDTTLGDAAGTTISPAPGAVNQVGTATIDPPDNATTEYTISTTRAAGGPITTTRTTKVRSVVGGTANFQYVRFKATKLKSGLATGLIQLAEFGFQNNGVAVPIAGATQIGANSPANEDLTKLYDGITAGGNKWLDGNNMAVTFDLGAGAPAITHYFFYTANDATARDPIQWTMEGSSDQTSWTLIDNVNFDYPTTDVRNTNSRSIPLPGASLQPLIPTFAGDGTTIFENTPLVLTWTTVAAATVSIDNGVGTVALNGSTTVNPPLGSTTYTLTASSPGGVATTTKTFTVNVLAGSGPATIDYANFNGVTNEFTFQGSAVITNGNLLVTPDTGGQLGEAWLRTRQNVAGGFEANFGLSMTHTPNGFVPADGLAFVIQNHPQGSSAPSAGEGGVTTKALNIAFKTFGFDIANASRVQVLNGTTQLTSVSIGNLPGITYQGITGFPYTMVGMPGTEPYRVRVVYVPGDEETDSTLDVYVNEVAVIENLIVDLEDIGAVDANGGAYVGFAARTGANTQLNQITYWNMKFGDFSALPPFGLVKGFKNTINGTNTWDLVWNASEPMGYTVQSTSDFVTWDDETSFVGEAGQIGTKIAIDTLDAQRFYRVVEAPE